MSGPPPSPGPVGPARLLDGWRLSVGTLTAIPVRPPTRVDTAAAGWAMLLAPIATLPLTALWFGGGLVVVLLGALSIAPVMAVVAVAALVLATRALHVDGLADVADGLSASYDRDRAMAVMKTGDVGPSGAAAIVLTLGLQAACTAVLYAHAVIAPGVLVLGVVALLTSRLALAVACRRGVPAATSTGLGATVAGSVGPAALVIGALALVGVGTGTTLLAGMVWWAAPVVIVVVGVVTAAALVHRAVARFGGITGDVLGASVEISCATCLTAAALLAQVS